ncbi:DUF4031 domain-containing protein [Salaquimonas pukyongi]|uniref:DUF4031 domain-containing protein n=1 Tax=Salaquimonas pukyongi TaxID=2712698 RepID=UPI00096BC658|nr:DUF4031 domain-containing protein [Salaquimonas pukyongi]
MAVYVDDAIWRWKGRKWCHLMADGEAELHRFAHRLGIHRLSYQGPPKTAAPHYDITGLERDRALRMGALSISRREVVALYRKVRVRKGALQAAE